MKFVSIHSAHDQAAIDAAEDYAPDSKKVREAFLAGAR